MNYAGTSLSFSTAMMEVKTGKRLTRAAWKSFDKDVRFVVAMPELQLPPHATQEPGPKVNDRTAKHIGIHTPLNSRPYFASFDPASGNWQPGWVPTQEDMMADDWAVISDDVQ